MDKEDRKEFLKFFIRLAEISFAVMIAAPAAARIFRQDVSQGTLVAGVGVGLVTCLIFLSFAFILAKRWK